MKPGQVSVTAQRVAAHRLTFDRVAAPYGDAAADTALARDVAAATSVAPGPMREYLRARTRFFDGVVTRALSRGFAQIVTGAAGYDGRSLRYARPGVLWFEVDHPATQQRKRALLAAARLAEPPTLTWVPVDFETGELIAALTAAGLDPAAPAFVSWLGVTMYLTAEAIGATLASLSRLAPGSELVTDYMLTADLRDADGVAYADLVMPDSERRGEPWLSFFTPEQMTGLLTSHGFTGVRDVRQRDAVSAALWERTDLLRPIELSRLCHATVGAGG